MRRSILICLFLMPLCAALDNAAIAQAAVQHEGILIRNIYIDGFVLGDKEQFVKLFRPYRGKYLTKDQMDEILHKIQGMYDMEGYQQLVSISYQVVKKHSLEFTVLMTS